MGSSSWTARLRDWADALQRRHPVLGYPIAVGKKYGDDQGARHAALLTYYGFLSLFPLLLLVVAVLSIVLSNNPDLRTQLVEAIVPVALQDTVYAALAALPTSGLPLVLGVLGLVLSGLGVVNSAFHTLNHVYGVPFRERPNYFVRMWRTITALVLLAIGAVASGGLTVIVGVVVDVPAISRGSAVVGTIAVTGLVMWALASLLLPRRVRVGAAWPALLGSSVAVTALLTFGAILLPRFVARSGPVYGTFATIVGLFALLSLVFQAVVISAESAVVRRRRLWPRALDPLRPTDADRRALSQLAAQQRRIEPQRITTTFVP